MIENRTTVLPDSTDDKIIPLTVELFGYLLKKGFKFADIGRYANQKRQNVSRFYYNHLSELEFIRDSQDHLAGNRFKRILYHSQERQLDILQDARKSKKASLSQYAVASGIAHQNYRLINEKSTQNLSMEVNQVTIEEQDQAIIEAEGRLAQLTGSKAED